MALLYEKYIVTKTDGTRTDPDADYFVLRLDTDPNARVAALYYAAAIEKSNPQLASSLVEKINEYHNAEVI